MAVRGLLLRPSSSYRLMLISQLNLSRKIQVSGKQIESMTVAARSIHSSSIMCKSQKYEYHEKNIENAVSHSKKIFSKVAMEKETLNKEAFAEAVEIFKGRDIRMRGHIQFIETALKVMKAYNVEKDITAYNQLFDVFPKGQFKAQNALQALYSHYPEPNVCAIRILQQMEDNGVMPNQATKDILISVFGKTGGAIRKYRRIMYWFPRFKNINPFPLPKILPEDPVEIARLGLKRIAEYEAEFKVQYLNGTDDNDSEAIEDSPEFIATVQSSEQRDMLHDYPRYRPVYVEGPFNLWLRDKKTSYFILRGHPLSIDDVPAATSVTKNPYPHEVEKPKDEPPEAPQEGPLFAMCSTNSKADGQEAMLTWVKNLQDDNPNLGKIPIYFNIFKSSSPLESVALNPGTTKIADS
ncbi:evolutionarily conserved signaling intermediate in Toll pathway, mitochondrial-like [Anneissia japonica]|uniref:evolutionarily conserved signaling intermediate in Toll pathway, mitochondrial-like n=1 Tax=Anneissia japonica TaxID=1529436 RepID=UPI0014255C77|nr:evolutionarily conserved signaling intermediate in Toll pathway, mitochondrial-like [Anneissia japonica]